MGTRNSNFKRIRHFSGFDDSNLYKINFLVVFQNNTLRYSENKKSFFFKKKEKKKTICESKKSQIAKVYLEKFSQFLHPRKFFSQIFFGFPIRRILSKKFCEFVGSQTFLRLKYLVSSHNF